MNLWDKLKSGFREPGAETKTDAADMQQPSPHHFQAGKNIEYDAGLIGKLHEEHAALLSLFNRIDHALRHDDLKTVTPELAQLSSMLTSHLYTENIKLYLYLQQTLAPDSDEYREMRRLRREMDGIGNTVSLCIEKYRKIDEYPEMKDDFLRELAVVVPILKRRIATEENTLYAMYRQGH